MSYNFKQVMADIDKKLAEVRDLLTERAKTADDPRVVFRAVELKALYDELKTLPAQQRGSFGKAVNEIRAELEDVVSSLLSGKGSAAVEPIDITAPWGVNTKSSDRPKFLGASLGSRHPLMTEMEVISDIFQRMGFVVEASREIDDDFHMFGSLNFPEGHPARDDWDTFMTDEGLIAPAHTSTMQNRVMRKYKTNLENGEPIAVVIPDRVFRNEDLDVSHEHTFYQVEGVYVSEKVTVGNLIAVLKAYMSEFFGQELNVKIQPFYFPFTEPSFEFAIERPEVLRKDDSVEQQWLEIGGCGMIHPDVLKMADIDPAKYSGFAWGFGIDRMVLLKNGIEDIRHFESGKLEFLRQFK